MNAEAFPLTNGTVVGRWKIGKRLGSGGQGVVWEVRLADDSRSPPRALKACFSEEEKERARFEREAHLLEQCRSEHILPILEVQLDWDNHVKGRGPFAYFVAERCLEPLYSAALKNNAIWHLEMFEQACAAVSFLHSLAEPVLHRDLKPQNFLLAEEPSRLVLADFGLARTEASPDLTKTHEVVGTKYYRAPEVLHGAAGDARSDIYSLGRMLEWLLTGRDPDQLRPQPAPRGGKLSDAACEALDSVVLRATATDPADRFASVRELREALPMLWLDSRPTRRLDIGAAIPDSAVAVYDVAVEHARTGDSVRWAKLEAGLRESYSTLVKSWRAGVGQIRTADALSTAADKLVAEVLPRLALPLAAASAGNPAFIDQRRCVEDLLTVDDWDRNAQSVLVYAPRGLVYVFHVLHGAVCLDRGRPRDALRLASAPMIAYKQEYHPLHPLWRVPDVSGFPDLFDGNCATAWEYILSLRERYPLIGTLFTLERDYRLALACYSMILNLAELATDSLELANAGGEGPFDFDSPPMFVTMGTETIVAASSRIFRDKRIVDMVLEECGAERTVVESLWPRWRVSTYAWAARAGGHRFRDEAVIPNLA